MLNVTPSARDVPPQAEPAAGCVVHHPPKEYPVFARLPELLATLTEPLYE
jgi:hypothetical protein